MKPEFLSSKEKKRIIEQLKEQYGISELPFLLIKLGREKIYGYSGNLSLQEMSKLAREVNIEKIGIYLLREEESLRLSFDATSLLKNQINKNIFEISEKQAEDWLKGKNIFIENKNLTGYFVLKYKQDFLGCGKASQGRITNFVPKERRVK